MAEGGQFDVPTVVWPKGGCEADGAVGHGFVDGSPAEDLLPVVLQKLGRHLGVGDDDAL